MKVSDILTTERRRYTGAIGSRARYAYVTTALGAEVGRGDTRAEAEADALREMRRLLDVDERAVRYIVADDAAGELVLLAIRSGQYDILRPNRARISAGAVGTGGTIDTTYHAALHHAAEYAGVRDPANDTCATEYAYSCPYREALSERWEAAHSAGVSTLGAGRIIG